MPTERLPSSVHGYVCSLFIFSPASTDYRQRIGFGTVLFVPKAHGRAPQSSFSSCFLVEERGVIA